MRNRLLACLLSIISSTPANSQETQGMELSFCNQSNAYSVISQAYKHLFAINDQISQMRELAIEAANSMHSDDERFALNNKYQELISQIRVAIKKKNQSELYLQNEDCLSMTIHSPTGLFFLSIPKLDSKSLAIDEHSISVKNKDDALQSLDHLLQAKANIESNLPSSSKLPTSSSHPNQTMSNNLASNTLYLTHQYDSKHLLASVVKLRQMYLTNIEKMITIADQIANSNLTPRQHLELSQQFYNLQLNYDTIGSKINLLNSVKLFNNNSLKRNSNEKFKHYSFEKISMSKLNIEGTSIINITEAYLCMESLDNAAHLLEQYLLQI